jgi:hypothetical protein
MSAAVYSISVYASLDVVSWVAVCCCSAAYQAWPVVHTTLSDAGLKGVDVEEVSSSLQDNSGDHIWTYQKLQGQFKVAATACN